MWADEYVRNESKAGSSAGSLQRLLVTEIRRLLPADDGVLLHASYEGYRWPGTDVEDLLFNNLDQMLSLFATPAQHGVRFEDLGESVPSSPDRLARRCYYAYRLARIEDSFDSIDLGDVACNVPEVEVEVEVKEKAARLAGRVWLAVRRARPMNCVALPEPDPFVLKIRNGGLSPGLSLKAVVDGATAAMQQGLATADLVEAARRLGTLLDVDPDEVLDLAVAPGAPAGVAKCLFTLDGECQVRVTPDDDRCTGAEIVAVDSSGTPRLQVALHAAKRR